MDEYLKEFNESPSKLDRDHRAKNTDVIPRLVENSKMLRAGLLKLVNIIENEDRDENEDDDEEKQGEGLKIITSKQILSRLSVLLAQIHAGNNSAKLKNEIRQLLYSKYRSKKISKTVYNNLIATM